MGVNMAGYCIVDDEACQRGLPPGDHPPLLSARCATSRQGGSPRTRCYKLELLMKQAGDHRRHDRTVVAPALRARRRDRRARRRHGAAGRHDRHRKDLRPAGRFRCRCCSTRSRCWAASADDMHLISPGHHRADPAPEGRPSGQPQPAPAHRRGADRPLHLRGHQPDRRACAWSS